LNAAIHEVARTAVERTSAAWLPNGLSATFHRPAMTSVALHRHSYRDYLALEEASNTKHEFLDGEIYAMAGGTPEHAALAVAVSTALLEQLRGGPCRVFSSDLRIRLLATGLSTYPDVTVVCGPLERDPDSAAGVTNPKVVVEVTSPGTEEYDRGEKLAHYQKTPSVQEIVFVSHRESRIERWLRADDGWKHLAAVKGETLHLASIDCRLPVDAIYRDALGAS